jgi:hypothetical protein
MLLDGLAEHPGYPSLRFDSNGSADVPGRRPPSGRRPPGVTDRAALQQQPATAGRNAADTRAADARRPASAPP